MSSGQRSSLQGTYYNLGTYLHAHSSKMSLGTGQNTSQISAVIFEGCIVTWV